MRIAKFGIVAIAAVVLATSAELACGADASSNRATVLRIEGIERELARATVALDPAPYDRYWANDFVGINGAGKSFTKSDHRAELTSGKLRFSSLDVDGMSVRVYGNTAVLVSRHHAKGAFQGHPFEASDILTSVYVRRGGRWQKIADHSTSLPNPGEGTGR